MNFIPMMIFILSGLLISVLGAVGLILQNRTFLGREKSSAYECGLDPNMSARIPFSLRLFLLAVIFLVFDVEIALLMGVPVSITFNFSSSLFSACLFIIVLIGGLFHEWREGSLNWM